MSLLAPAHPRPGAVGDRPESTRCRQSIDAVLARALAKDRDDRYAERPRALDRTRRRVGRRHRRRSVAAARGRPHLDHPAARRRAPAEPTPTPSEQNRQVTALYANAAEYATLVEDVAGGEASRRAMNALWETFVRMIQEAHVAGS